MYATGYGKNKRSIVHLNRKYKNYERLFLGREGKIAGEEGPVDIQLTSRGGKQNKGRHMLKVTGRRGEKKI